MDMNAYAEMKSVMGDVFHDVINTFLEFMPGQIQALGLAVQENNNDEIFAIAHRIKSSSGSIGALGLASLAEQLEMQGKSKINDGNTDLFQQLQDNFDSVVSFLQAELA